MQADEQGRGGKVAAWLVVGMVHAGLFWLLTTHNARDPNAKPESRMRLLMLAATPRAPTTPPPPALQPKLQIIPPRAVTHTVVLDTSTASAPAPPAASANASAILQQSHDWVRQQAPTPTFTQDPLRSRRAQLPGGERTDSFRMREPRSLASALSLVGKAFGDPGPPCPRVQARLYGLLTATSDKDRKLLEEELRRDQQFCRD
jgi:hypothetical protein